MDQTGVMVFISVSCYWRACVYVRFAVTTLRSLWKIKLPNHCRNTHRITHTEEMSSKVTKSHRQRLPTAQKPVARDPLDWHKPEEEEKKAADSITSGRERTKPRYWTEDEKKAFEELWFAQGDAQDRGPLKQLAERLWTQKGVRKTSAQVRSYKQKWLIRMKNQGYTHEYLHSHKGKPDLMTLPPPLNMSTPDQSNFLAEMEARTKFWCSDNSETPSVSFSP